MYAFNNIDSNTSNVYINRTRRDIDKLITEEFEI